MVEIVSSGAKTGVLYQNKHYRDSRKNYGSSNEYYSRKAVIIAFAALVSGCGAQSGARYEIETIVSEAFAASTAEHHADQVDLSKGFVSAIMQSVELNERFKAQQALERRAIARLGASESVKRPQIGAAATIGTNRQFGDTTSNGAGGTLNISQTVFDGGASDASISRATAELAAAKSNLNRVANEVAIEAARAWIDTWQYQERLTLLKTRSIEIETVVSQIERMVTSGLIDRADVDYASRQVVEINLEERRLEADMAEAKLRFQHFFGQKPNGLKEPNRIISMKQAYDLVANFKEAPELRTAAAEALIAGSSVAEAKSAFRPRVRLQANAQSPNDRTDRGDVSVGFVVEYVFNDGGKRQRDLEAAEATKEAAYEGLTDAANNLSSELQALISKLELANKSTPLVQEQIVLSASEAQTARSQIATGQSSLRSLIEAELQNYRAKDKMISLTAVQSEILFTIAARSGFLTRMLASEVKPQTDPKAKDE